MSDIHLLMTGCTFKVRYGLSLPDFVIPVRSGTGGQAGIEPNNSFICSKPNVALSILPDGTNRGVGSMGSGYVFGFRLDFLFKGAGLFCPPQEV